MSGYYWIKFYHEVLDDAKMAVLPDRLWRRFFELCLLAGTLGVDGVLPNTQKLAWRLRMQTDDLSMDMVQLSSIGIIQQLPDGWLICKFAKRQEAVKDKDRKAEQRARDQKRIYYGDDDVTNLSRNVTQINRLTDKNREDIDIDETISTPFYNSISTSSAVSQYNQSDMLRKCEQLYQKVTGQFSIPSGQLNAFKDLENVLDYHKWDIEAAVPNGKLIFASWCNTVGKTTGKTYSRTNTGWISKWIEQLSPQPEEVPVVVERVMTEKEKAEYEDMNRRMNAAMIKTDMYGNRIEPKEANQ